MDLGTTSPYGIRRSAVVPVAALGHHEGAEPRSHRNYGGGGPGALPQWQQELERLVLGCGPPAAKSNGCRRTAGIAEMQERGVARFQVSLDDTVSDLQARFPDQKEWLKVDASGTENSRWQLGIYHLASPCPSAGP